MKQILQWIGLAICAAVGLGVASAQDSVQDPVETIEDPIIEIEQVHPAWETFTPEFTPYVCPFHAAAPKYDPEEFRCGYVLVLEDRTNPDSRLIKLSVLKIAATTENPDKRAVIRLTGGPGGTSLVAGRIAAYQRADTKRFRDVADLIFFDQRGIGYSEAHFCRAVPREFQLGVSTEDGQVLRAAALKKCLDEARAEGIAVDAYSTWQNALDVRDIRRALGYDQWTLFGVSYGTELGQAVLNVDEDGVRAAILDSVVPANPLDAGGWGAIAYGFRSSLTALDAACAENSDCARDVGSFADRFIAAFESYDEDPLILEDLDHGRFLDGRAVMDGDLVGAAVFQALYVNSIYADFPSFLRALETRDEVALRAYVDVLAFPIDHNWGNGMELVANCRGAALVTGEQSAEMATAEPKLSQWIDTTSWTEFCGKIYDINPDPAVKTLVTDVPILVAAGTVDPITPPYYGQSILPGLSRAQYVEMPYTGHGALYSDPDGCGGDLWIAFVSDPMAELDTSCTASVPAPDFVTRLIETKAPYRLARGIQAGTYPNMVIAIAALLVISLIVFPLGWTARKIQGTDAKSFNFGRPLAWVGALVSLGGLGWAISQILNTATNHALALPIGVLPSTGWAFWMALIGFGLTAFALVRAVRSGGFGRQQVGASLGIVITTLASFAILLFLLSLGLGPF
ncbi:MAG: alpha/beta hydrolase [Pseudomonadota bacterium]